MPITLICPAGHRFDMAAAKFQREGARCPECKAVTWRKAKTAKPAGKVFIGLDTSLGPDKSVEVAVRDNGDGTMTVESVREIAPRTPHPMMAMQEGETCAEARAKVSAGLSTATPTSATGSAMIEPGNVREDVQARTEAEEHLLDAEESPRMCDLYPVDHDLDDPDSPRHQGVFA